MRDLGRLLRPRSIAVVGGGSWCVNVIDQCRKIGFSGHLFPVHPTRVEVAGEKAFSRIAALPEAPDAAFIGVNREATVEAVGELARAEPSALRLAFGKRPPRLTGRATYRRAWLRRREICRSSARIATG